MLGCMMVPTKPSRGPKQPLEQRTLHWRRQWRPHYPCAKYCGNNFQMLLDNGIVWQRGVHTELVVWHGGTGPLSVWYGGDCEHPLA
jgi:hypothetical protein